ncbi:MAG TPA: signal peptidase II [Kofleriaceae bacterium]|nr:signal peptidase II [Kofleriaceae bacterium]
MADDSKTELPEAELRAPASEKAAAKARGVLAGKWAVFWIVAGLSLAADQATKIWARAELPVLEVARMSSATPDCDIPDDLVPPEKNRGSKCVGVATPVIDSFWHWRLSMNQGSAFGLFSGRTGARIFLSIVGVAAVFGMLWMLRKSRADQKILHWALAFVAGGAVGNLIDRVYYGVVTDFILWHVGDYRAGPHEGLGRWEHEWPVFNIADVVLVVGVGLMFIDIQKEGKREKALRQARKERQEQAKRKAGLVKNLSGDPE